MTGDLPVWAKKLMDAISATIEFKGLATLEGFYSPAEDNGWGVDLIEIAPGVLEIEEAGEHDGEGVYGLMHDFDLLATQQAFDSLAALHFGFDNDGQATLTFEGQAGGNEVVVIVYTEPFEGAEPDGKIDFLDRAGPRFEFYEEDEDDRGPELPEDPDQT